MISSPYELRKTATSYAYTNSIHIKGLIVFLVVKVLSQPWWIVIPKIKQIKIIAVFHR